MVSSHAGPAAKLAPVTDAAAQLPDGSYDAIVVDAVTDQDGSARVELTILDGDHKGEVVAVRAHRVDGDGLDLLGIPATLVVAAGTPSVSFEP